MNHDYSFCELNPESQLPKDKLYHYTSLDNLMNVIKLHPQARCHQVGFWASDIGYQNDHSERLGLLQEKEKDVVVFQKIIEKEVKLINTKIKKNIEALRKSITDQSLKTIIESIFNSTYKKNSLFSNELIEALVLAISQSLKLPKDQLLALFEDHYPILYNFIKSTGQISEKTDLSNNLAQWFYNDFINRLENDESRVYTLSLSEKDDDIDQWERYANQGLGVAIGLDRQELANRAKARELMLGKCDYISDCKVDCNCEKFKSLAKSLILYFIQQLRYLAESVAKIDETQSKSSVTKELQKIEQQLQQDLINNCGYTPDFLAFNRFDPCILSVFLKNGHYLSEREWRLVQECKPHHQCRYRSRGSWLIPYVEWDLGPADGLVTCITLGPANEMDLVEKAVNRWKRQANLHCEVIRSRVPFRKMR